MDISKYRVYVRDIGLTDDDLYLIIQDVINEIASTTNIFKSMFVFPLEKGKQVYNIKELFDTNERTREYKINMSLGSYTDDQIIDYLTVEGTKDIDVNYDKTTNEYYNQYLSCDDILKEVTFDDTKKLISIFNYFDVLNINKFKLNTDIDKYIDDTDSMFVIAKCTIIPNISNIDSYIESIIKYAIIEGIRYYSTPSNTNANEQVRFNNWNRYHKAKLALMSNYPTNLGSQKINNIFDSYKDIKSIIFDN